MRDLREQLKEKEEKLKKAQDEELNLRMVNIVNEIGKLTIFK
ncbi:MAG: hypothetical protein ACTSV5_11070 [Promethearchaeota archaeon]